jgi:hypothetical protein
MVIRSKGAMTSNAKPFLSVASDLHRVSVTFRRNSGLTWPEPSGPTRPPASNSSALLGLPIFTELTNPQSNPLGTDDSLSPWLSVTTAALGVNLLSASSVALPLHSLWIEIGDSQSTTQGDRELQSHQSSACTAPNERLGFIVWCSKMGVFQLLR